MYTFQALWTAAHHRVPAKFVVCNNGSYQILKDNIDAYWQQQSINGHSYPSSFNLRDPDIAFTDLARSLGVEACVAGSPEAATTAVDKALGHPGPYLVDLATS
jgi:benzoylformate decarboxylase